MMRGAEPFYLKGGDVGCLLIHGFTASPLEMRRLGELLHEMGYSILAPLLPGHGTVPEDLEKIKWQDWVREVEEARLFLEKQCSKIIIIGFSMGALLSLYFAARKNVDAVVAIAPPIHLCQRKAHAAPLLKYFRKSVKKEAQSPGSEKQEGVYPVWVLHGTHEMLKLRSRVKRDISLIKKPVLLIHAKNDRLCCASSVLYLYERLQGPLKILKWLNHSGHQIPTSSEVEEVARQIQFFIENVQ